MTTGPLRIARSRRSRILKPALESLEQRMLFAFGVTTGTAPTGQSTYVVDNGGDLKFSIIKGGTISSTLHLGDLSSVQYKGQEILATYAQTSRYSHYEQGLGSITQITTTVNNTAGWILVTCDDSAETSGGVIQYYAVRKNDNNLYMASLPTDVNNGPGEGRFIAYLSRTVFPSPEAPSDNNGTTGAIEGSDVFGHADGTTTSKFYNMNRLMIDNIYHGVTGTSGTQSVGAWMFMGDREHSAGGPFFKDIDFQSSSTQVEMYNCLFTGHTQTEAYRQGLEGPYALQVTNGSTPTTPDYSWLETVKDANGNLLISGLIPASQRGTLTGTATGVPSGHDVVVGLANSTAQYWTRPNANGTYTITGIQPGTYTETLYDTELGVGTKTVTITAGATTSANIVDTFNLPANPIFRIGTWDGTPLGFLNTQADPTTGLPLISIMHPSDVRMSGWNSTPNFVVGTNTDAQWPSVQFMGVNNSQRITFNLASNQVQALTFRVGITWDFSGARPKITVNSGQSYAWTSSNPAASADLNSRGITRGTWRGVNQLYTFDIPSSAFRAGTNTIDLPLISGSYVAGQTWLSPNVAYDAIDLVPTTAAYSSSIASVTIMPTGAIGTNGARTFTVVAKDSKGNVIPANFDWSASNGTIDANGSYLPPANPGTDTISVTANRTGIPGYNTTTKSYTAFGAIVSGSGSASISVVIPPSITNKSFNYQTGQALSFTFNEDVLSSVAASNFVVTNASTGTTVPAGDFTFTKQGGSGISTVVTLTHPSTAGLLPDANYHVAISGVTDSSGVAMTPDTFDFFVLSGDANHNGVVDTSDFTMLAQNFNRSTATWDQGDFNYDGRVNALDFNTLASNFGDPILGVAISDQAQSLSLATESPSLFSDLRILHDQTILSDPSNAM